MIGRGHSMKTMGPAAAEAIAIQALGFLAADPERLQRFLDLGGMDASDIRAAAAEPGFLAGVMQHVVGWEPLLLEFSREADLSPEIVASAARALGCQIGG
jgi:hypothetical protein